MTDLLEFYPLDRLQKITLKSPFGEQTLTNVSLNDVSLAVQQQMQHLLSTSFYSKIIAHYGVKKLDPIPNFEDFYNKKLQYLKQEIKLTQAFIRNIFQARTSQQLQHFEQKYERALFLQRRNAQYYALSMSKKYEPYLYLQVKRKHKGYFNFSQNFTNRGSIQLAGKVGLRSNVLPLDTFELNYSNQPALINRGYSQFSAEWVNRFRMGQFFVRGSVGTNPLYRDIDYSHKTFEVGYVRKNEMFQIEASSRSPWLFRDIVGYSQLNYHLPSTKFALKYKRIMENSMKTNEITTGTYSEIKTEVGLPFLAQSRFFKLEYNRKKYYDVYWLSKYFDSQRLKKLLFHSSVESSMNAMFCLNYSKHRSVVDFIDNMSVRGFDKGNKPLETFAQLKSSIKFNIHNYPILSQGYLVPFLYAQAGMAFIRDKRIIPHVLGSTGLGLGFAINLSFRVQLLSTLFSLQSSPRKEPIRFQIRFSFND